MRRLSYTAAARRNLEAILRYIARQSRSVEAAEDFAAQLLKKCDHLASLPGTIGRSRPELGDGIRSISFKGYLIFFRYLGDTLEVLNVLEGHRDIERFFEDKP